MKAFVEERINLGYDYGATGGPSFNTIIVEVTSGRKYKNIGWGGEEKGFWQLGERNVNATQAEYLADFFRRRRGMAVGFRYKDWLDFKVTHTIDVTESMVAAKQMPIVKIYGTSDDKYTRRIRKPVDDTFTINLITTPPTDPPATLTYDHTNGMITLPDTVSTTDKVYYKGEFDVPVEFATDDFKAEFMAMDDYDAIFHVSSLPIEETRTSDETNK